MNICHCEEVENQRSNLANTRLLRLRLAITILTLVCFLPITLFSETIPAAEPIPEPKSVQKKAVRDPMMPVDMSIFDPVKIRSVSRRLPFKIQGVGHSDRGSYVIIGGKVYREGETKGEITVVKIGGTQVDILVNDSPESLPIKSSTKADK